MSSTFFIPAVNIMGTDCLDEAMNAIRNYGFRKALIVTDAGLAKAGVAGMIAEKLAMQDIDSVIYDGAKPNPNVENVEKGLALLQQSACDFVVSLGGGSPHDCAKGIALCATNGGHISDYEGVDQSSKPQMPLVAINTTAGTASEMTRFCIITDETRHVKMAIVDRNVTPLLSVNDPSLMVGMPKGLTAATGMDALTHAIEAYVSTAATPITDACAIKAIELIAPTCAWPYATAATRPRGKTWPMPSSSQAWRSTMPPSVSCMPWPTNSAVSMTCLTACATRCCCPMYKASTPASVPSA